MKKRKKEEPKSKQVRVSVPFEFDEAMRRAVQVKPPPGGNNDDYRRANDERDSRKS